MGIDVYLVWDTITKEEESKQICDFSQYMGHVGYLREIYFEPSYAFDFMKQTSQDPPYAIEFLIGKYWENLKTMDYHPREGLIIPNKELQERFPKACEIAIKRQIVLYKATDEGHIAKITQSLKDFVALHKQKEEEGLHPKILIEA